MPINESDKHNNKNHARNENSSFQDIKFSPYKRIAKYSSGLPKLSNTLHQMNNESNHDLNDISKNDKINNHQTNEQIEQTNIKHNIKLFCTNCKLYNHSVKACKQPIRSYGLIIFDSINEEKSYEKNINQKALYQKASYQKASYQKNILLVQRKDTYQYIALIENDEYLPFTEIARKITREEHHKILTMEFEELWNDVMGGSRMCNNRKVMYQKKSLFEFHKIKEIVQHVDPKSLALEPPWSFPKGRLKSNLYETAIDCAIRETCEETYLKPHDINVLTEEPIIDTQIGDDGKTYMSTYFFAVTTFNSSIANDHLNNPTKNNEIRQCKFVPISALKQYFIGHKNVNKMQKVIMQRSNYEKK